MVLLDYVVLVVYFLLMVAIGVICSRWIKAQEDYFMGGRGFGKLLQTFAAFGAGTGSNDPIQVGRTVWTSGLSGIWSVLLWLFATPFYWIFAVWYRRMRHLTLGDWFVERYQSRGMGAVYTLFGIVFYILYLSTMFSAISKVVSPMIVPVGAEEPPWLRFALVCGVAAVVIVYSVLGGLRAAYWTDLVQGLCIISLSVILIPAGLSALAQARGEMTGAEVSWVDGFQEMHERMTPEYFAIVGGPRSGEFPLHYIVSLTALALVGIVVQPHFIATGGGSAKTENNARVGLVVGNFLKRLCTIGWALTGLIVLALFAGSAVLEKDPDYVWGMATRELLGPMQAGLVGLMLACLLAALMSSASAYMVVSSGLMTRNVYAAYIDPHASEMRYVLVGRLTGLIIIVGAAVVSLGFYDVFKQFLLALESPIIFAAPFWIGMYWRRATPLAAWLTVAFTTVFFFVLPPLVPVLMPQLKTDPAWTVTTHRVTTVVHREARYVDVARREAERENARLAQEEAAKEGKPLPAIPEPLALGEPFDDRFPTGGRMIFWSGTPKTVGPPQFEEIARRTEGNVEIVVERRTGEWEAAGDFQIDFLLYRAMGVDLTNLSDAMLTTLRLPTRIVVPFVVMVLLSLVTPRSPRDVLDRYYAKMKTPVDPDPLVDQRLIAEASAKPELTESRRLFPAWTGLEVQKPRVSDVVGFIVCFAVCFLFVAMAAWLASIGSS